MTDGARGQVVQSPSKGAKAFAGIVRCVSVPPILISALLVWFYFACDGMFASYLSLALSIVFLGGVPLLAYAVWAVVPRWRRLGRRSQRKLAFVFSLVGYTGGLIYALVAEVSRSLLVIFLTYFLSAVLLTLCNKVLKFRASGHGCGVTGPLLLPAVFVSPLWILPSMLILSLVYLSSLLLKRHSMKELLTGSGVAVLSFVVALLLL